MDYNYGAADPLDQNPNQAPKASLAGPAPLAIPTSASQTVVIATFTGYDVVLSRSHRTIYTEETLTVEEVLQSQNESLGPASKVTLLQRGGTVQLPAKTVEYLTEPRPGVLVPNHRYVLFLEHHAAGDFYWLAQAWELLGGKVEACLPTYRPNELNDYEGMDESKFLHHVREAIRRPASR
ncbi:MAG: hypothetical protein ACM336_11955 [Acidobacteriota bacterium]